MEQSLILSRNEQERSECAWPWATQTTDVFRMLVRQGMSPVVLGLLVGLGSSFALGRLLSPQLYQFSSHNPLLLVSATNLMWLVLSQMPKR
jgi:hypothetical protein